VHKISLLPLVFLSIVANAQNIESIGKEKPLAISGGVSLNQIFYGVSGIEFRRDPYTYFASGNVNFSLYGWSVPLSFSVSNQNTSFQQPFNQYSLHPTYKSVTAHLGYTSMSYSPYTVSGHIFLGGAVDVAPEGKWNFSGLYGRFLKDVEPDTVNENATTPAFKRMGYGFKSSYADGKNSVDVILFYAKDDINSIQPIPDSLSIFPEENLVVSLGAGTTLFKNLVLRGEIASSALTRDTRAIKSENENALASVPFLYQSRESSSYYKAYKTALNYQQPSYTIGVAYERVDPQYKTLGAYFFNSDLENITLNTTASFFQSKITVAASGGKQRDNLDDSKISTLRRLVGSLNLNYVPSQKLNFSATYSTFQTYTNIRSQFVDINQLTPYENLDTLNFTQLSKNATLNAAYSFGADKSKTQNINFNVAYQGAADEQGGVPQNSGNKFYNANAAYAVNLVPQSTTLAVSINITVTDAMAGADTKTLGPTASIGKSFFNKKVRTTLSSSYNTSYTDGNQTNTFINGRFSASVSIQKKHNINVSSVVVNRKNLMESGSKSFTEFTGTLGYAYSFSIK
jgi:hypothetical protein